MKLKPHSEQILIQENYFLQKSESSTEYRDKIQKSTGMYVKFFQSSFTVNMDIAPLSDQPIQGKSEYEPVYVNSLTYGRLGIIAFETDESYEFAETCIKKNLIESSVRKQLL